MNKANLKRILVKNGYRGYTVKDFAPMDNMAFTNAIDNKGKIHAFEIDTKNETVFELER